MKRRKFLKISSRGAIAMSVAPVILNNLNGSELYELHPTEGYLPAYSRTVARARRSTIRLVPDFPAGTKLQEWPVTFGVPFPRGAIADVNQMRIITDDGIEVPAQISRTATWHSPDGDIKWVLVDMTAKQDTGYLLEYGTGVQPAVFNTPLQVKENDAEVLVETGPLRVSYDRSKSFLPAGVWIREDNKSGGGAWKPVLSPVERMYMVDQKGVRYTTSDRAEDYKVEVEEKGRSRVTVKISGWYRSESGEALCMYNTRIDHYAGQPFVKMVHTFIVAFDTDKIHLRDIAIPLRIEGGKIKQAIYQAGLGLDSPRQKTPVPSYLIQETARRFTLRDKLGKVLYTGKRCGAWVSAMNKKGGLAIGAKNFWQEFPRELEVGPKDVVVHLWPKHGDRLMDLSARSQLGPRYEEWDRIYWQNWYLGGLDKYDQAYGLAKTSELIVSFHQADKASVESSYNIVAALEEPPLIHNDPEWIAITDVFGPLQPRDTKKYPNAEKVYDAVWDHFRFERENMWNHEIHTGNYGFFDYGDVNYDVIMNQDKNRWEPTAWRRMASRFYGSCILPWLHFVRSGDRRHLRWAIDNARHVMDIDMCHLTYTQKDWPYPKYKGGRYGGNGGIIHYGGNIYGIGPDSHVAQWKWFYYLTGDRRAWDVLQEEGEFYLGVDSNSLKLLSQRYNHRENGGALYAMVELWNATWDKRYIEAARGIVKPLYAEAEQSRDSTTLSCDVYMNPGMVTYYQATGEIRMKDLFLHNMRQQVTLRIPTGDSRWFTGYGPAMAFYFTGDPSFLNRPLFLMQQYFDDVNMGKDPIWYGVPEERWAIGHNTVQMIYGPYLLKALADWRQPVKPAEDLAATSGEIWIENPIGKAFTATVYWTILSRPFYWGLDIVREWPAYAHRNHPKARLLVLDPDGRTVKQVTLKYWEYVRLPYTPEGDYPFSGKLILDIPEGIPGLYRIVPFETGGVPLRIALLDANGQRWGLPFDRGGISHGPAYYFRVPSERKQVTLRFKFLVNARKVELSILDRDDNLIATRILSQEDLPTKQWTEWLIDVPEKRSEGLWRLVVRPSLNNQQILYLQTDEMIPFISLSPEEYFTPSVIPPPILPKPGSIPAGLQEEPRILEADDKIILSRGMALTEKGSYENINSSRGTLEFWIKPEWDVKDFEDAILLSWGGMQLIRRSQHGMILGLSKKNQLVAGFILMPDHWYHIAITWDVTIQRPFLRLYINGTKMAATDGIIPSAEQYEVEKELPALGDWTTEKGILGGTAMTVGGIIISKEPKDQELITDKKYLPLDR